MKKSFVVLALFIVLISSQAFGITINFGDNSNYWPGWNNNTSDDSRDMIGIPGFNGGTAVVNSGRLTNLSFGQDITSSSVWSALSPGDLFIDTNADKTWDYFVDLTNWNVPNPSNSDPGSGDYPIYSISLVLNDATGYIFSGQDDKNGWSGYYIRDNHPVAYGGTPGQAYGQVHFSGWPNNSPQSEYTFDFTGLSSGGLALGQKFTIGWTVNCANDVVYETINNHAPEPATMILLGSGLVGLAGLGRKKFFRK